MATPDKIESVQKLGESSGTKMDQFNDLERVAPNKEHFQNLINSNNPIQNNFQRVDDKISPDIIDTMENNPIFTDEQSSSQKSGSATDQEGRRGQQQQDDDDAIEGVGATRSDKNSVSSVEISNEIEPLNIESVNSTKLIDQTKGLMNRFEETKTQLGQLQEVKPAYQNLMRNHLTHIDDNLKIASTKAGVESSPEVGNDKVGRGNPATKFIDSLTQGQANMDKIIKSVSELSKTGQLTPGAMLTIQLKMNNIQQEIELFSNLLNKLLESTKTIMNVQV